MIFCWYWDREGRMVGKREEKGGREREEGGDRLYRRTFIIPAFQFVVDVDSYTFL